MNRRFSTALQLAFHAKGEGRELKKAFMSHNDVFPVPREWAAKAAPTRLATMQCIAGPSTIPKGSGANRASAPDLIQWVPYLPKTRSGKIMRRILRKIAEGDYDNLGDVSTLADPRVVQVWLTIAWGADNAAAESSGFTYL